MAFTNKRMVSSLTLLLALGCGKKGDDNDASSSSKPAGVLEAFAEVNANATKLNLTAYESGTGLSLVEEEWDEAGWDTTTRFNCFGECSNGSITARQYVDDAVNEDKSGPLGTAVQSMDMLCIVGALYADNLEDGLPKIGSIDFEVTADIQETLEKECDADEETMEVLTSGAVSAKTTDVEGDDYDRKIVFSIDGEEGEEVYPFYYKNSDNIVAVGIFEKSGDETDGSITRSIFKIDLATNIFRMEYYSRDWPKDHATVDDTGFSFYRGFFEGDTGEVRFFSNMGNSNYALNNTFLSLSGNTEDTETQAGAYLARTSDEGTALEGAFVCFLKEDGSYVNNTGCTENEDDDRKITWSPDEELWVKVEAKDFDDLTDEPGTLPDFTAKTMFTVEPEYK